MYIVYILKDERGKFYKGMTNNIERRLKEHRSGYTKTTGSMKNLKLVYQEKFDNVAEARKRELYFKSAAGRRLIKKVASS